jgi:2-polyprenyl-3-methyl-5-hydroxy-6-metoxy-1,4-benzoquinol methylase
LGETPVSSNLQKYQSKNKFKQIALNLFFKALLGVMVDAERILDAGCGEGFGALNILSEHPQANIYGADLSAQAVKQAKQIVPQMPTAVADVTKLPFPENQFDMVVSLEVLEHLPQPELAVEMYKRLTRRYLLLSVPNEPVFRTLRMLEGSDILRWGDHPEHIMHWNFISFANFLKRQGLKVLERRVPFPFSWVIILAELDD